MSGLPSHAPPQLQGPATAEDLQRKQQEKAELVVLQKASLLSLKTEGIKSPEAFRRACASLEVFAATPFAYTKDLEVALHTTVKSQHDLKLKYPAEYNKLPVQYGVRFHCYVHNDSRRKIVWPPCLLSVFMSINKSNNDTTNPTKKSDDNPVPLPRKFKVRVVDTPTSSTIALLDAGEDYVADFSMLVKEGMNVLTLLVNGHEEIRNYCFALDFVAFLTSEQMTVDVSESIG
ncbi:UNVERIFIED_CONTAM: hypothetical protein HDU68_011318, partial [Siphonaria sp. JEL0065]